MVQMYYVFVTGSAELSSRLVEFTRALGKRIMADSDLVLVTGGLKQFTEGIPTADWEVKEGALEALEASGEDPADRILTLLPHEEYKKAVRFHDGRVVRIARSNLRSRRYAMVYRSDAVIGIEGHGAVKENLDLAWILGKPLLPVPCTGGKAKKAWDRYGEELWVALGVHDEEVEILDGGLDDPERVADCCLSVLRRTLRARCFLAMKFDEHPAPWAYDVMKEVATKKCYEPVRVDELPRVGNIVDAIWAGIRSADTFVADISANSPNVFYELGIAHALRRDVIILLYSPSGKLPAELPFDIRGHRVFVYSSDESLHAILERELRDQCRGSSET